MENDIYIPLWLYYNLRGPARRSGTGAIYIPLWLYYNVIDVSKHQGDINIYIPLWLYYNAPSRDLTLTGTVSTFHSGYITMIL